jgi:hypothetical protein
MDKLNKVFSASVPFAIAVLNIFMFQYIQLNDSSTNSHNIYLFPVFVSLLGSIYSVITLVRKKATSDSKILPILGLILNLVMLAWMFFWYCFTYVQF